jgi:hypothetical protein
VAVESGVAYAGSACDVVEACNCSIARESLLGDLKNAFAIALCVGTGFAGGLGWRGLLFLHGND